MPAQFIPASEIPQILADGHLVLDVRSAGEFRSEHLAASRLLPLQELDAAQFCQQQEPQRPVYLLCQSGKRATIAARQLEQAGHHQVFIIEGGLNAARAAGVELLRSGTRISIERQVRIAAGALVVLGCLLSLIVHPWFIGLPLFVGAGLAFAGITDSCGMGMLLARMPWNTKN